MLTGAVFFYKGRQKEAVNEKLMLYGFASQFLTNGFITVFLISAIMYLPGTYENHTFYVNEYDFTHPSFMYIVFMRLYVFTFLIGHTIFYYTFERVVKRTLYLITITFIALIIFHFLVGSFISLELSYIIFLSFTSTLIGLIYLVILVTYTRLSSLEGKAVACFFYL